LVAAKKQLKELNDRLAQERDNHQKEIEALNNQFTADKTNSVINQKLNSYALADAYQNNIAKTGIFKNVADQLHEAATVKLGSDGSIKLFQKENPDLPIFDKNNKEVTFEGFVEPIMKDFVKKSDPTPPTPPRKKEDVDFAPNSMAEHLARRRNQMIDRSPAE
jgi:hypothetical protein